MVLQRKGQRAAALLLLAALWLLMPRGIEAQALPEEEGPALGFHIAEGDAEHMAAAEAAGGRFVVLVFSWRDIQPTPEHFYWETPDAALRAAEYYGLEVVARLDRPPEWARSEEGPMPWDLDSYANFVRQVALRYGMRLAGAIVWNEPNLALEWEGRRPDAGEYATLLKAAYPAIKEAAPALPVLAAGLAFSNGDGVNAANDLAYLKQLYAEGAGAYFDILAAHPYGFGQPPTQPPAADRLNFRRLELHRAIMAEHGDAEKPVWVTEMGWRTSAPEADRWQVVTPQQQRDYTIEALAWAQGRPWLQRMALWELTAEPDQYGYALWQGPNQVTAAYTALAERAQRMEKGQAGASGREDPAKTGVEILAPDVVVRLGDRGDLHPHWVHLHRGGRLFSPDWRGEFFLGDDEAAQAYELVLETMQVDQPTNRIAINGYELAPLRPRTRPDPTSTWVTQRLVAPPGVTRPGVNEIRIYSGVRLPVRQYGWWRWENFQFRHIRLAAPFVLSPATIEWEAAAAGAEMDEALRRPLSGWAETNRLRVGPGADSLWLMGNRVGQLWQMPLAASSRMAELQPAASNADERVFLDLAQEAGSAQQVAATDRGLLWQDEGRAWGPVSGAPPAYTYVVIQIDGAWYAGFEGRGVWRAVQPQGPWQAAGLQGRTVLDLAAENEVLYAATDDGIHRLARGRWTRLPALPSAGGSGSAATANFVARIWLSSGGNLLARSEDRLYVLRRAEQEAKGQDAAPGDGGRGVEAWEPLGPEELQGRILAVAACCGAGTLLGTNGQGLWRQGTDGAWQRVDDGYFADIEISDLAVVGTTVYASTANGLFSQAGNALPGWRKAGGLPATVTDLLAAPTDPTLWVAATPAGIYRSVDGGGNWATISPPWVVWDLAWGADGTLWAARSNGVAVAGSVTGQNTAWDALDGMETITFFSVSPDPQNPGAALAGSWGNDIGATDNASGSMQPLHNGLETLSVLSILRHPTPGQFTIGTIEGLYRSDDGGASWFKLPGRLTRQTVYALHQTRDGAIWAGAADGLWHSGDYGGTWQRAPDVPPTAVIRLGEVQRNGRATLWAGTEDSGVWLSADSGVRWEYGGLAGRSVYAVIVEDGQLIAATDDGLRTGR